MTTPAPPESLSHEQSGQLAEFARTCRAAARAVSLYPKTHPSIGVSLGRVVNAAGRLAKDGSVTLTVQRDMLTIDGHTPLRPDPSIGELAMLLHDRLIGILTIRREADVEDWHAFLMMLARPTEELMADGGVSSVWTRTGRTRFEIREIDYAEALRERGGGEAEWDRIVASCLKGERALDERALASLLDALGDPARFAALLNRINTAAPDGIEVSARVAALLQLMKNAIEAAKARGEAEGERALQTIAASCANLTPDTMIAMLERRQSGEPELGATATAVAERMTHETMASFLARSVAAERGATQRLAQALEVLVPSPDQKERVVRLAKGEALQTELGADADFDQNWQNVSNMVMSYSMISYSDESFVSDQYGRELSDARRQAIEVERVSDDPPERVQSWVATVSEPALRQLDLAMLLDLLRIEEVPDAWEPVAHIAASEVEHRTLAGNPSGAVAFVEAIVGETTSGGRRPLRPGATRVVERLCTGPLARHVGLQLRTVKDNEVEPYGRLCKALGPGLVRPLADALAREESSVAVRRLGALLLGFGAAGRQSVEQLKNSSNPAVRRTAVTLLRGAAGAEALSELASMLGDTDPAVQRESIQAIVEIGTDKAYAVLHRLLLAADTPRDTALMELVSLRDDKAARLFAYVLSHSQPRGKLAGVHLSMVEALGKMTPRTESIRALQQVLQRSDWWAPFRTTALHHAAATSLRTLGTTEAVAALEAAAATGSRGVRKAARAQIAQLPGREGSSS
jgi:hypothetical protein